MTVSHVIPTGVSTGHRPEQPVIDLVAAEMAAGAFLAALGVAVDTDATRRTAVRMAAAYAELLTIAEFDATAFPNAESHHDLVIACSVPFTSLCAHHMLPFVGIANVGYLPGRLILGLSKLARTVELFAARPQVQEEMTQQIATWLEHHVGAEGVGVMVTADHLCMTRRGVQAHGATAVTTAWRGTLADDRNARAEFIAAIEQGRTLR